MTRGALALIRHLWGDGALPGFLFTRFTAVAPNGVAHARHEIRCCRGLQSTNAHSRSH
jgi:hypothetical protein